MVRYVSLGEETTFGTKVDPTDAVNLTLVHEVSLRDNLDDLDVLAEKRDVVGRRLGRR